MDGRAHGVGCRRVGRVVSTAAPRRLPVSPEGLAGLAQVRALLADRPRDETLTVGERRAGLEAYAARTAHLPVERLQIAGVPVERHAGPEDAGVIVHAHGGAFVLGSAATHRGLSAMLVEAAGATVCSVDYRLAPEHPFPAGRDDVVAVCAALAAEHPRFALFGDSAGGGLVIDAACALRDAGGPSPVALACTSPWMDLRLAGESLRSKAFVELILTVEGLELDAERYAGRAGRAAASPLSRDLHGLPSTLVQVGEDEVLLDDAFALADRLLAAGVPVELELWEHMTHSWHAFRGLVPEAEQATARLGAFLSQALKDHP